MIFRHAIILIALALLACNREPYSRSNSGMSALDKKVLYDFRGTVLPAPPRLDATTERRVLGAALRDRFVKCPSGQQPGVLPHIAAAAAGSFTAAGAKETAYLVQVGACDGNPASGANRLLVFAGDRLVAAADTRYFHILKTYSLTGGDGGDELLLAGGRGRMGEINTDAALVRFDKNALATVENFGSVYHDLCGMFRGASEQARKDLVAKGFDPIMDALVISYLPRPDRRTPPFVAQRYRAPCPANENEKPGNWVRVGEK